MCYMDTESVVEDKEIVLSDGNIEIDGRVRSVPFVAPHVHVGNL